MPSWVPVDSTTGSCSVASAANELQSTHDDDDDVFEGDGGALRDGDDLAALGLDAGDIQHFFGDA